MTTDATAGRAATLGRPVMGLLEELRSGTASWRPKQATPFPTGFRPLDQLLNGGLRAHELTLIGGQPAVGKTIATLQWARNMALAGSTVVYACYEHEESELLARLLAMELGSVGHPENAPALESLRASLRAAAAGHRDLDDILATESLARAAYEQLASYGDRLVLVRASGRHTGLDELEQLVTEHGNGHNVLMVDYLQKVAVNPQPSSEEEKITLVAEGLKDLALTHDIAVVAVTAADRAGLESRRLRLQHLRGSSALAYESDLIILMNEKIDAVSKVHLAYDSVRAPTFRSYTVFSVEKNRSGPAMLDMEFRKDFANFRFDPEGNYVVERLIDERLYTE